MPNMLSRAYRTCSFFWLRGKYVLLRHVCNHAVAWHVKLTPMRATDDTLREIALENIAYLVRRLEFRCYSIKEAYEAIGETLLDDYNPTD